jgi:hypothetical protein
VRNLHAPCRLAPLRASATRRGDGRTAGLKTTRRNIIFPGSLPNHYRPPYCLSQPHTSSPPSPRRHTSRCHRVARSWHPEWSSQQDELASRFVPRRDIPIAAIPIHQSRGYPRCRIQWHSRLLCYRPISAVCMRETRSDSASRALPSWRGSSDSRQHGCSQLSSGHPFWGDAKPSFLGS